MTFERGLLIAMFVLTMAIFVLSGFDRTVMAVMVAFAAGGLVWLDLIERVPYRWLYRAYFGGLAFPVGLSIAAGVLVR